MNDLLNDLNKLYDLNAISFTLEPATFKDFQKIITPMIKEKENIIKSFEKENMPFAEYSEYMKGVGFNA